MQSFVTFALAIQVFLIGCAVSTRNRVSDERPPVDGVWVLADGEISGTRLVLRYREDLHPVRAFSGLPMRLSIVWTYGNSEAEMPRRSDSDAMEVFEDAVFDSFADHGHGILVAVVTNAGRREWVFYVEDDHAKSIQLINELPQLDDPYPIGIERSSDPNWVYLSSILEVL